MTPSTHTLARCVPDFHVIEIDSVSSSAAAVDAYNALSGGLPSTKSMFDVVASRCSSYGAKNGLNHVLDGNLTTTLADDLNSKAAVPFQNGVLHNKTGNVITRNHGDFPSASNIKSVGGNFLDGSADDVSVDVVSVTSGDLRSLHRSLCQNAQGNYDLDDATPVEPFVQELVQWKKVRVRPKKSLQGGSVQFAPSGNKRKKAPSDSRNKKQKTSPVEKLGANVGGPAVLSGVSRCVIAPSIVEKRFVYFVPEVSHINTVSSIANKPSELRQFRNRLPVEFGSNSLTTIYNDLKPVAISDLKVGADRLFMINPGANTPLRQTDASITASVSTPNPAPLQQTDASITVAAATWDPAPLQQTDASITVAAATWDPTALQKTDASITACASTRNPAPLRQTDAPITASASTPNTAQLRHADASITACASTRNPAMLRQTDAPITASDFTPGPAIFSQFTTSQQPSPSPDSADASLKVDANGIIDNSKAIESPIINSGAQKETSQVNEAVCTNVMFDDVVEVVDLELEESDVDEGEELLLADTGADLASAVQFVELRSDDVIRDKETSVAVVESLGEEQTIELCSAVSDEVFGSDECELTALGRPAGDDDVGDGGSIREGRELRSFDGGRKAGKGLTPSEDELEGTLLCQNLAASEKRMRRKRGIKYQATALTWESLLRGKYNKFSERETGVVSVVKELRDVPLSTTQDSQLKERLLDNNSPVVQRKVLPLEYCKELSSNSVTRLIKRGKHWFKKIFPSPPSTLNELERASQVRPENCRTDSLPSSHSVTQTSKPCREIASTPPPSSGYILYVTDPIVSSTESPTNTAEGLTSREDQGLSGTSIRGAVEGPSHHSPSLKLPQDHPEVQFVAMEDVTEVDDDNFLDAAPLADDCDPLGEEAEDPFSDYGTVDACRGSDDTVGSDGSLQEHRLIKSEPRGDFSDSGLGSSVHSNSFNPRIIHMKSDSTIERSSYINRSGRLDERSKSNSIGGSLSNITDVLCDRANIRGPPPYREKMELPPPPGVSVRKYNLTNDGIHFHQCKQMIMDPRMIHQIQHIGDGRLPGVCDAEDFILRNFSSNNYVFCEVDPNTSRLPQGLHRFNLQVKGNRVYRSRMPRLTFRIQDSSCDDTASEASVEHAAAGDCGTSSTEIALPSCSGGLTDAESTSSYPRLSTAGSLVMRNPHADLKRYLLASDRLQKLFDGLQQIQRTEKAARLSAHCSSNGLPLPAHAEALRELYSKRVHMQVHFYKVLQYLKETWFREKIHEANCRAAANNRSTSQHAS